MGSSLSKAVRQALGVITAAIICFGLATTLTGCPVGAKLENEERFLVIAGSGGGGPAGCDRPLPEVSCDWRAALGATGTPGYCFKGGCHNATTRAGELDLTADTFLISRLLNVPAKYDLSCPGPVPCVPAAMTCSECAMCTPGKVLIDAGNPGMGYVFDKLAPFVPGTTTTTMDIGCGDAMPTFNTSGSERYTQANKDCLIEFFTAIAETPGTWPCVATPMGGAGGGGAGGAGAGGMTTTMSGGT